MIYTLQKTTLRPLSKCEKYCPNDLLRGSHKQIEMKGGGFSK